MGMVKTLFSINAFFLSSIIIFIIAFCPSAFADPPPYPQDAVIDIYGQSLRPGRGYFIYDIISNYAIVPSTAGPDGCPIYVAISSSSSIASPVSFLSAKGREGTIRLDVSVTIQYTNPPPCVNSSLWQVAPPDKNKGGQQLVTLGGEQGKPGCDTIRTWFKIRKVQRYQERNIYNLVYDPNDVCDVAVQTYGVGYGDSRNEVQLLALVDVSPIPVVFQPVN
ncbi:kunitz trypsin inhibitor 5-like [Andrographis paniculata]|uniref:kunitz trypsin inhibitor 5-like n=1 Tax=Andrographis paniculata TaxID=175694 RepID=UPI0021E9A30C|nr:kunitz trypsin inhibitor 5-like [Andrographis paniculata]